MIEGILDTIDTRLKDATVGINALVTTHNTTASFKLLKVETIDVWEQNKLPSQMLLPALLGDWQNSPRLQLTGQGKWRGEHTVRLWYWINAVKVERHRRHQAGMASVLRAWVDTLAGQGTIAEVRPIRMDALGWRPQADLLYRALIVTLPLIERDEQAVP